VGTECVGARPRRPHVRHAHHGRPGGPRGRRMTVVGATDSKAQRQRAIRELVSTRPIGSQREVVDALSAQGFEVTQATVSRDISELGLVKAPRVDGHVYVAPASVTPATTASPTATDRDARLERILGDIPDTAGRSGLIV